MESRNPRQSASGGGFIGSRVSADPELTASSARRTGSHRAPGPHPSLSTGCNRPKEKRRQYLSGYRLTWGFPSPGQWQTGNPSPRPVRKKHESEARKILFIASIIICLREKNNHFSPKRPCMDAMTQRISHLDGRKSTCGPQAGRNGKGKDGAGTCNPSGNGSRSPLSSR